MFKKFNLVNHIYFWKLYKNSCLGLSVAYSCRMVQSCPTVQWSNHQTVQLYRQTDMKDIWGYFNLP